MKTMMRITTIAILLCCSPALAQTAGMLSFQGLLKDADGVPVSGSVTLQFRIYDAQTGGNLVDMDGDGTLEDVIGQDAKEVSTTAANGVVSTKFGPVLPKAFDGNARWLEVRVNGTALSRTELASATATAEQVNKPGSGVSAIDVSANGNVAIGTTPNSLAKLHIARPNGVPGTPGDGSLYLNGDEDDAALLFGVNGTCAFLQSHGSKPLSINSYGNNVGIGTSNPRWPLEVRGELQVRAISNDRLVFAADPVAKIVVANVLQITGGSDLAEPFAVAKSKDTPEKIEPGMVVVIDPENPGQLKLAREPYDRKVAGVISGANGLQPGMVMTAAGSPATRPAGDSASSGDHPVALTGRVYVWADASSGPIEPGDMLTTSATPGHAMRADDKKDFPRGCIIGKAMGRLEKGKGLVLVLVQPQ